MLSLSGDPPATVEVHLDNSYWTVRTSSGHVKDGSMVLILFPAFIVFVNQQYRMRPTLIAYMPKDICPWMPQTLAMVTSTSTASGIGVNLCHWMVCRPTVSLYGCTNLSAGFYDSLKTFADYGPSFQRIRAIYKGIDEVLVQVAGTDGILK